MMLTSFMNVVAENDTITINPGDSIQKAVNNIADEGTIILNPGVYNGDGNYDILIKNKRISLRSYGDVTIDAIGKGRIFSVANDSTLNLNNVELTNGYLVGTVNNGASIDNNGTCTVTDSILLNNYAEYGGAAINNNGLLTVTNSNITYNEARATYRAGVGIRNYGECYIYKTIFDNNIGDGSSSSGGAIMSAGGKNIEIKDSIFTNNTAGYGGAIYISSRDTATMINNTFENNRAYKYGGAVANYGKSDVSDSKFMSNEATFSGALYNNGTIMLDNSILTGNQATHENGTGGGLLNNRVCAITKTNFIANFANNSGGAVFSSSSDLNVDDCDFNNNVARVDGGGINVNGDNSRITNSTFESNIANNSGGGISVNGFGTVLDDLSIYYNNATVSGGGISLNNSNHTHIGHDLVKSNYAKYGGGISINGGSDNLINDGSIDSNEAYYGGGLFISNANNVEFLREIISNNVASVDGGGVYINNSVETCFVGGNSVTGNIASGEGAGIWTNSIFNNCGNSNSIENVNNESYMIFDPPKNPIDW
jgi:hypothetical protein